MLQDKIIPETISYSALSDWSLCPQYYYLSNVLRLRPYKNTPDTFFGTLIHRYVQGILKGELEAEKSCKEFERKWGKLCRLFKLEEKWLPRTESARNIFTNILPAFQQQFGNFKVLNIERKIAVKSGDKYPQLFKGYIDIVIELENGDRVIADFKTADSSFFFMKYKDAVKDYQLSLYKWFYCSEENFDKKKMETYFVVLEKNPKSKKPISIIRITSGDKKLDNATNWMNGALSAINRGIHIRKKSSCYKFGQDHACMFCNSEHCPKSFG